MVCDVRERGERKWEEERVLGGNGGVIYRWKKGIYWLIKYFINNIIYIFISKRYYLYINFTSLVSSWLILKCVKEGKKCVIKEVCWLSSCKS